MTINYINEKGKIDIGEQVVAVIAGMAAIDSYGIVGMASRHQIKDGISELLKKDNLSKGIEVYTKDEKVYIDLHIVVSYGVKISEVAQNVQEKVKYILENQIGVKVEEVNVIVQGVKVLAE
ncbi:Asp23/Gls24 family envelope stress response protein [Desulfuribacillus alkaliarsenatis]|uniref:Alkaline-shock protein n=1 Tax=Desulfuribacillus alkaliarsenatis TaxID=766136 RepID=A0A1E5G5W0_9FIRM|nr:Asp23/Gls24 family envelope stress response protein [Desulfuribacillus alkaliarsenatis]OEF98543.1 hypothetical protein BHF68_02445 [Desulfuribacillus alkaliarsenatis]